MEELFRNFGVDWRLLIAQVVNFSILFFLLKKFAYRPILDVLRKRADEIKKGFAMRAEAEKTLGEIDTLKAQSAQEAQEEALALVKKAEETGVQHREEIIQGATLRAEALIVEARGRAEKEAEKMQDEVTREAEDLVREGIARVLGQMPAGERDKELIAGALAAIRAEKMI